MKTLSYFVVYFCLLTLTSCAQFAAPPLAPLPMDQYEKHITFTSATDKTYTPTKISKIKIFQNINHFKGLEDEILSSEVPDRPYEVIGVIKLKEDWYYASTLHHLMISKIEELGGDAVLKYETFQSKTAFIERRDTGEVENVYLMKGEATIIKYLD